MPMSLKDDVALKAYLDQKVARINTALEGVLRRACGRGRLADAMRYALMAGGKRLRPVLCMAAAEAVDGDAARVLTAACALEAIHTYSLIHDDLPAMDDDNLRRGKPTCHVAFDEATAILAGDALLTLAFELLAEAALGDADNANEWLHVIAAVARAAGCAGMILGQMRDIAAENASVTVADMETTHRCKTGALIEASVESGALLGGGTRQQVAQLRGYARQIGLAFQVADDILNVEGDPALMGKAAGTDATRSKATYPSLIGLTASKRHARDLINNALQSLEHFGNKADPLRAIARFIVDRKR